MSSVTNHTLTEVCGAILSLSDASVDPRSIADIAQQCKPFANDQASVIADTIEHAFSSSSSSVVRIGLWQLVDRLCKTSASFIDVFRPRLNAFATIGAPSKPDAGDAWRTFLMILDSLKILFGNAMAALLRMKMDPSAIHMQDQSARATESNNTAASGDTASANSSRSLTVHSTQLRTMAGGYITKQTNTQRTGAERGALQVRTVDSLMAMTMASAYAPARPVEIQVPVAPRDEDAPVGYVQALPANYNADYEAARRKRLREVMERNRQDDDRRARERLMGGANSALASASAAGGAAALVGKGEDYSDVALPEEFPRDEFGVKRGNFPAGVRFIRDAIRDCGGAVELDVIVHRISTLANKEVAAEFGDVREFLLIHKPTFRIALEGDKWVVRLSPSAYPLGSSNAVDGSARREDVLPRNDFCMAPSLSLSLDQPLDTSCPYCTRLLKSRNLARHVNCRRCITTQIALGVSGTVRSPISELGYAARWIIEHRLEVDDDDISWFGWCIDRAASVRRYRLSSTNKFLPVLKAIRAIRDVWLLQKGLPVTTKSLDSIPLDSGDAAVIEFFRKVGANIFRLPVSWIETGDLIDMAKRFCSGVKPAHDPPPRPADPRIHLQNTYPGMLLCESEVDSEDEPSDEEKEFSDEEGEAFQYAPPVTTVETLTIAGFERDTKRLNYKLRTAPPLVHTRVLQASMNTEGGGGPLTLSQAYSSSMSQQQQQQQQRPSLPQAPAPYGITAGTGHAVSF